MYLFGPEGDDDDYANDNNEVEIDFSSILPLFFVPSLHRLEIANVSINYQPPPTVDPHTPFTSLIVSSMSKENASQNNLSILALPGSVIGPRPSIADWGAFIEHYPQLRDIHVPANTLAPFPKTVMGDPIVPPSPTRANHPLWMLGLLDHRARRDDPRALAPFRPLEYHPLAKLIHAWFPNLGWLEGSPHRPYWSHVDEIRRDQRALSRGSHCRS